MKFRLKRHLPFIGLILFFHLPLQGSETTHVFVVAGRAHSSPFGSYSFELIDSEKVAHARHLIQRYRLDPTMADIDSSLPVVQIVYERNWVNRDYFQPGAPFWSWRVTYLEFNDMTIPEYNVSPAWVEVYGERRGMTIIAPLYTVVAEVPLSYETLDEDGTKSGWFGRFHDQYYPWVQHGEHGWVYIHGLDPEDIWIWDERVGHLWTTDGLYPWLWSDQMQDWLYYQRESESPRWFHSNNLQEWVKIDSVE